MGKDNGLSFPFADKPEPAELIEVAPGVHWLRMPLPIALNHINLWLLEDGDGWTIVDTGVNTKEIRTLWEQLFETKLDGKPVTRLIVTHMHPDHVGLAGWLTERWDIDLWMSRSEYMLCRLMVADHGREAPPVSIAFHRAAGFDDEALDVYRRRFGMYGAVIAPLPEAYRRLVDGQIVSIGDHDWTVVVGEGHSPEHACLLCPELNVIIGGDQLLPTISPNISVRPTEPYANPLGDWLQSCEALQKRLPADALILPAHGYPYHGVHERLRQLIAEHEEGLAKLNELCAEPQRAVDTFPALFKGKIGPNNLIIAVGEALAHLHYLVAQGGLVVAADEQGVNWYRRAR